MVPACTLSPICSSDICTDFPFSILTFAIRGKHGGGGAKSNISVSYFTIINYKINIKNARKLYFTNSLCLLIDPKSCQHHPQSVYLGVS